MRHVLGLVIMALSFSANAETLLYPTIKVGMTKAQVKAKIGDPEEVEAFGKFTYWIYIKKWQEVHFDGSNKVAGAMPCKQECGIRGTKRVHGK
jgi:outer membrane protein assembly factor BamE (lipoprotein component of BamABCDE complex)